ncbi:MAG: NADH:ubiquinone reductase (Na(+)-transporting) subunit B [Flavobacteriales bacterium]|nr:NADH:ubiquinone reductase (Na(+)-transporting) subunit B [Flavobacteriales bacterium]|tara:strand:- start:13552 stop:14763 length:1212 start_codon:yes stop_codon:yes gene_type:complete
MKLMKNILKTIKPNFEKGGKLHTLYPAYDAFETFLFVPNHTSSEGAHIRDSIDLKRTMVLVIIALLPCLIFGMWNTGYQYHSQLTLGMAGYQDIYSMWDHFLFGFWKVLPLIIVSYVVGLSVEFAFAVSRKHQVNEGYLVTGMLIPLVMPIDVPLWMLALSVIFAVVIGKEVFGGTGMNILNPALTARAFIFFAYPTKMSGDKVWVHNGETIDAISGETALGELASLSKLDVVSNQSVFNQLFSSEGMYSLYNSFIGTIPGSVGETSVVAILIGAFILLFTGVGSRIIMSSMFLGGLLMAYIFNLLDVNLFMSLPAIHQLCVGGFFFGMVFMATDPVSAAQTNQGKFIYGFLCGVLSILIRVVNPAYPEGVMVAILFMNVMAPLIDHYVVQANINRRLKRIQK